MLHPGWVLYVLSMRRRSRSECGRFIAMVITDETMDSHSSSHFVSQVKPMPKVVRVIDVKGLSILPNPHLPSTGLIF